MTWADRLDAAVEARGNPCLVGLDPHLDLLPPDFEAARDADATREERAGAVARFLIELIDVVADVVPAVKPQSAFFEALGAPGVLAWENVVAAARDAGLLVIGDVKRSDISSTARAYAEAYLESPADGGRSRCDAITVNPFLGADSIDPFLEVCARAGGGLYVLVRTSNPGGADVQLHGDPPLCDVLARAVHSWGERPGLRGSSGFSSVGAVVGATRREELAHLRELMPDAPLLLPGYGAQGATADDVVPAFRFGADGRARGALINSSRGIAFAWRSDAHRGKDWKDATRGALAEMVASVGAALDAGGRSTAPA